MRSPAFHRGQRGFTGAEKALLITFGLAIIVLVGGLLGQGSERAARDAERTLRDAASQISGIGQTVRPMSAGDIGRGGTRNPPLSDANGDYQYSAELKKDGKVYRQGTPFVGGPGADDVRQGNLGDCWFLASLAAVARRNPQLIRDMISGPDKDGNYQVTFYTDTRGSFLYFFGTGGNKVTVTVDGKLPVRKDNGEVAYAQLGPAQGDQVATWVAIVEKAWAVRNGGYPKIDGGYSGDALQAITGWKSEPFDPGSLSKQDFITKMRDAQHNGQPAVADLLDKNDADFRKGVVDKNLVVGHSYVVLDVRDDGSVLMQNPWGFKHPGTRNDGDPPTYISYDDFVKYYSRVVVSKVGER